jgi:hypothetical protein
MLIWDNVDLGQFFVYVLKMSKSLLRIDFTGLQNAESDRKQLIALIHEENFVDKW